jgi:hypothetical protein
METRPALPNPPSALSRRLSVVAAREHGIGPEQLPLIGIDPDIFDVFYREHIETVADAAGRRGDAISWEKERGFGRRFIFDPRTSKVLSDAEMIFGAKAAGYPGLPDDTVFRETAYLGSAIVDSGHETGSHSE